MERAFLRKKLKSKHSPYARFYLTLKAHKLKPGQTVDNLKSRPIVSCPGSLFHGLGVWVDRKLQEVAQRIVSYFKNTLELKKELLKLKFLRNARLFTADAVSMYTNIPTHTALNLIGKYLHQYQRKHNNDYPKDAVRTGLRLVMTMNIFTFGDLTLKQLNGTAMGTPPAPPYTTIYYGLHEEKFLPHYAQRVVFYSNRSLLSSGGLMADVPCLDHSLDSCKGRPDDVQTTKHARRTHAWSRCARTSLGAHASLFGASGARFWIVTRATSARIEEPSMVSILYIKSSIPDTYK